MHWSQRLNQARARYAWSQERLASEAALPLTLVEKYCRGEVDNPRGNKLEVLAKTLKVSEVWLQSGVGVDSLYMPVSYYLTGDDELVDAKDGELVFCPGADPATDVVFQIKTTGLEPYIHLREFALAVIQPSQGLGSASVSGAPFVLKFKDGRHLLKIVSLWPEDATQYDLISLNPRTSIIEGVRRDEIESAWLVAWRWSNVIDWEARDLASGGTGPLVQAR